MKRVNFKFLLVLIGGMFAAGLGFYLLRQFQVSRHAGTKLEMARKRLAEGKAADAMSMFAQYVALRPDDDKAFAEYSKLLLGRATSPDATRTEVSRAFTALETAVRGNPDDDALRLQLAEFQLRVGRATDAREHLAVLQARLDSQPAAADDDTTQADREARGRRVGFLQATSYLGSGEFEEAARIAARLVGYDLDQRLFLKQDTPGQDTAAIADTDAFVLLAAILQERYDSPADARRVLEELVARQGDDPRAWLAMTSWYREQGDRERAEAAIAKALELAPDEADCVFAEFELALAARDLDRARDIAQQAVQLFPDDERAYRGLAAVLMERGELAAAEPVLLDGVERLPGKASLQLMLTDALLQQNKLTEAGQAIARIRELYGATSGPVGLLEARLLVAEGRWNDAKAKLEQVRPLVLGNGELIRQVDLYLGQCHAQLNEYDAQLEVNRRILTEAPGSLAARAGAAQALISAGKTPEALAEFEAIAAALSEDKLAAIPQVWYPLLQLRIASQAELPAADRDWSGIDRLLEVLTQSGTVPPAQLALLRAEALVRQDEPQAARELLEAASAEADPQIWSALVSLVLRSEGPEAAVAMLGRVPEQIRNDPALLLVEARAAAGLPADAARERVEGIAARADGLPAAAAARVFSALAPIRLAAGDREAARRLWEKAAAAAPEDLTLREAMLEAALVAGDLEAARGVVGTISGIAGASSARTRVAEASVKLLEARQLLAKLEPREPGRSRDLPDDVGPLLDQARNLLVEAENERPGWSQIQVLYADVEGLRGNPPAAIDRLRRAIAVGPANPALVRRLVALLYSQNRLEEAQQAMASLGEDGVQGLERISAEVELRAGKFDDAVALAEQSVAGDTQNHEDLLWLGQLLVRSGKMERAGEILERATVLAPEEPETWFALFSYRLAAGSPSTAENALERAAALMPEPRRQLALAQGYQMLGRGDEAGELLEDTARRWPDNVEALRGLASFQIGKGRRDDAQRVLERILETTDDDAAAAKPWARRALAELQAGRGSYRDLQQGLQLLQANRVVGEPVASEDLGLEISLLSNRPEPASWRRAVTLLDELSKRQPLTSAERLTRAQLREKLGEWPPARDDLVALVANPKTPPAYVALLIEKLIAHGEASTAKTWMRRLEKTSPDSAITLALQAKLAMAENDRPKAIDYARRLMPGGAVPVDKPAQLAAVARLMEDLGFAKAADRVLERYAEMELGGIQARVEFLGRQGKPEEALDLLETNWDALSLERALSLSIQVLRSQVDDAAASLVAGRIGPWIVKAKRLDPGSVVIRLIEAELQTLQGRGSEAEGIYRDLLAGRTLSAPQAAIVSNNLAFHLAKPATVAEAGALIDKAIAELGPLPDLLDTRGLVRLAKGEHEAAVADLKEATLAPSAAKYLHLAAAQLAAGDEAAARESLEAARAEKLGAQRLSPEDAERLKILEQKFGTPAVSTAAAGP